MPRRCKNKRGTDAYELYRRVLRMPDLTEREIREMRKHLTELARTICEHVWGERFY